MRIKAIAKRTGRWPESRWCAARHELRTGAADRYVQLLWPEQRPNGAPAQRGFGVYGTDTGRICVAALNNNVTTFLPSHCQGRWLMSGGDGKRGTVAFFQAVEEATAARVIKPPLHR